MMIFTSGTTGRPKGALHGIACFWAIFRACKMPQRISCRCRHLLWTRRLGPGRAGLLQPCFCRGLYLGVARVVAGRFERFEPALGAGGLMGKAEASATLHPATALRMLKTERRNISKRLEALAPDHRVRAAETLAARPMTVRRPNSASPSTVLYGQTRVHILVLASCAAIRRVAGRGHRAGRCRGH